MRELEAKAGPSPVTHYQFGPFTLDMRDKFLLRDGKVIPLTPKVFEVLAVLVQSHGHVVGKDQIMKSVWPDSFVEESNLTQNISVLRRALGDGNEDGQLIETVPRRGYRFTAPVRELTPSRSPAASPRVRQAAGLG